MLNLKSILSGGGSKESPASIKNIKQKSKETAKNLVNIINEESVDSMSDKATPVELLGSIYKLLVKIKVDDKIRWEMDQNKAEQKETQAEKRHQEIIEALTIFNFGKKKIKIGAKKTTTETTELKPGQKPATSSTTPAAETTKPSAPAAEAPKPSAPTTPAPTPTPPAAGTPKVTPKATPKTIKPTPPKATKQTKKPAEQPKKAEPVNAPPANPAPASTPPVSPPPKVSGTPPVPNVGKGAAAAAAVSIAGETYASDPLHKKVGQVVGQDPEAGHYSYGMFGMNSKSKSIHQFVQENPQLGFKENPGSTLFNEEFKKIATERTQEMYDAQLKWYEKHVYGPTVNKLKQSGLPANISKDQRVISYMSDRYNQMGGVAEASALKAASSAKTPEEFIDLISSYDLKTIETSFPKYLSQYTGKERENRIKGLVNRIEKRRRLSQINNTSGTNINSSSVQNRDLHNELNTAGGGSNVINQTNINVAQSNRQTAPTNIGDDTSAYERKSRA